MSTTTDWIGSPDLARFGRTRAGDSGDAVGGVVPRLVIEPTTAAEAAGALAWLSRERLFTVITGSGTKLGWGRSPSGLDVLLTTRRLNRVVAHRHGDLTATIESGAMLTDVNDQLGRAAQWLPLDSAFDRATIGGLVATNDAGPLRHRYGTPRDVLIGMTIAVTDGRIVKSGGHVVKNVAGYDLGKLVSGSFGALALIVDATFKLSPMLPASRTLVVDYETNEALASALGRLSASQLEPLALDTHVTLGADVPVRRLLVRFATSPDATAAQAAAAQRLLRGTARAIDGDGEGALWSEQVRRPWSRTDTVVRLSWLPASLPQVLALLDQLHEASGSVVELTGRAALGAGFVRTGGDARRAADLLRAHADVVTHTVVLQRGAETASADGLDVWGDMGSAMPVLRAVKAAFDPAGFLNAGRGPV
jgi:glycolate oxidase FAD binding subunit